MDGKQLFVHKMRTTGRIFEIQTASIQVWSKWWQKNIGAENRLPVLTGKGYLLISWELLDGFSKFKRHMLRFDRSDDLTFSSPEIYFRCEQKDWKFWKYFSFKIERATTSCFIKHCIFYTFITMYMKLHSIYFHILTSHVRNYSQIRWYLQLLIKGQTAPNYSGPSGMSCLFLAYAPHLVLLKLFKNSLIHI